MTIPIFQWTGSTGTIHFGCVYKGIQYWQTHRSPFTYSDKWDVCPYSTDWHNTKPQIAPLSYLVITGEPFDIKKVLEQSKRGVHDTES